MEKKRVMVSPGRGVLLDDGSSSLKEAPWSLGSEGPGSICFRQVAGGPHRKPFNPWYLSTGLCSLVLY